MKSGKASALIGDVTAVCAELEKILEMELAKGAALAPEEIDSNAAGKELAVKKIEEKMAELADCGAELGASGELSSLFADAMARLERVSDLMKRAEDVLRERRSDLSDRIQRLRKGARGFRVYRGAVRGGGPGIIDFNDEGR